jgi:putative transposase
MTYYPSNLSDKQWELIKDLLPQAKGGGYERKHARREMLNAIFYINKTGCQWRYLPGDFPPWSAVYSYFRRLSAKNIFEKINAHLNNKIRLSHGRDTNPSLFCIDSQSVHGDVNLDQKGTDGHKKVKGRKRHIVTDVLGLIFFCIITAANVSDIHPGREFINQMSENDRLEKVLVDSAYQGIAGEYGKFKVEVSGKKPDQEGFIPIHKRWVVERTFAWLKRQRRLARDYEFDSSHQRSMVYIGISKIMLNRLA